MPQPADERRVVDFLALAGRTTGPGPAWVHQGEDLNVNLVVFGAGEGVAEHVNAEVDVLIVGVEGRGYVEVDGRAEPLRAGQGIVVPRGMGRAILAESERFAYLTCHRRRSGLWPQERPWRPAEAGGGAAP